MEYVLLMGLMVLGIFLIAYAIDKVAWFGKRSKGAH